MSACDISLSFSFAACAAGLWDWLMAFIPGGFPSLTFLVGLTMGALLGPKALALALVVIGFLFGRRSVETHEHVDGKDAAPPVRKAPKGKVLFPRK